MFIAHLPAGYCVTTLLLSNCLKPGSELGYARCLWIGLCASVLPDLDLIYFYFIDHRQHPHHAYMTHIPIYWFAGMIFLGSLGGLIRQPAVVRASLIVLANVMLHLLLDSVASRIHWLFPLSDGSWGLFRVSAQYGWWVWNYALHWTFGFEIMIVVAAGYMLYYKRKSELISNGNGGTIPLCG